MQPVFLIGDIRLAKEILDKRSTKFSSRPTFPYVVRSLDFSFLIAHFTSSVTTLIQPRYIGHLPNKMKATSLRGGLRLDSWPLFEPAKLSRSSSSRRCLTWPISLMMQEKIGSITWTGTLFSITSIELQPIFAHRVSASMVLSVAFGLHCPTGQEPDLKEVVAVNSFSH